MLRVCDAIRSITKAANTQNKFSYMNRLRCTELRKYLATTTQVRGLRESCPIVFNKQVIRYRSWDKQCNQHWHIFTDAWNTTAVNEHPYSEKVPLHTGCSVRNVLRAKRPYREQISLNTVCGFMVPLAHHELFTASDTCAREVPEIYEIDDVLYRLLSTIINNISRK